MCLRRAKEDNIESETGKHIPHEAMRPAQAVRTLSVGRGVFQAHLGVWERVRKLHGTTFPNPPSPAPFLLELGNSVGDFRRRDKVM